MLDNELTALAFKAYREVQIEMGHDPARGGMFFPELPGSLEGFPGLAPDSLLLGIAADGLPLLLHLRDPRPGAVMLVGERGSGKTAFLRTMLSAAGRLSAPSGAQFAILTAHPADFEDIRAAGNLLGVWALYDQEAAEVIRQAADRVQFPDFDRPLILMIDGLEAVLQLGEETRSDLAYILANGPQSLVWPVVTLNSEMALKLPDWLACFHTTIYGRITNPRTAEALTPLPGAPLDGLFPGSQFCLRIKSNWLKFWLPSLPA